MCDVAQRLQQRPHGCDDKKPTTWSGIDVGQGTHARLRAFTIRCDLRLPLAAPALPASRCADHSSSAPTVVDTRNGSVLLDALRATPTTTNSAECVQRVMCSASMATSCVGTVVGSRQTGFPTTIASLSLLSEKVVRFTRVSRARLVQGCGHNKAVCTRVDVEAHTVCNLAPHAPTPPADTGNCMWSCSHAVAVQTSALTLQQCAVHHTSGFVKLKAPRILLGSSRRRQRDLLFMQ